MSGTSRTCGIGDFFLLCLGPGSRPRHLVWSDSVTVSKPQQTRERHDVSLRPTRRLTQRVGVRVPLGAKSRRT